MASEVFSTVFTEHTNIVEEAEDDINPCEEEIRHALDKALDDDIEDIEDWSNDPIQDTENINPNNKTQTNNNQTKNNQTINTTHNMSTKSNTNSNNNSYNSHQTSNHNNLKQSYQHNGGQWPLPQPPQPLHPYLKMNPYPMSGPYPGPYPAYAPYPYPPQSYGGYDSATYDSSETGNNTEQMSRDDYYPIGSDNKSDWNSYSENGNNQCGESVECGISLPLDSEVFNDESDVIHPPEQLNALYRANQRKLEQITSQLQDTQDTYNKQIHQLQHKVGMLQTEKNILESQLSQNEVKTKELEEVADKEKLEKEEEKKTVVQLKETLLNMELELQEKSSEVDRLSYQLRDTVPKKESNYYEQMVNKVKALGQQETNELKRKLDEAKRGNRNKDLEIEKLKVELQNSVRNKITGLEQGFKTKETGLKKVLYELILTLPKINMIDVSLPLVTEIEACDLGELTAHVSVITSRLCDSDETPRTLVSRINDLTSECATLRHTAAQLENRVVAAERQEKDALSGIDSKDRTIQFLQQEVAQLQDKHKHLHSLVNETEQRADQAIARERGAMEKLGDAEKRCEETLIEQTNILKRLRTVEETNRLEKMGLENRIEESRLKTRKLEEELDKNKEMYISLSQEKISLQREYEDKVAALITKDKEVFLSQIEDIKKQCQLETDRMIQQKEEDMLQSFECERRRIETKLEEEFKSKLQVEIDRAVKIEVENSQKQWSGSSNATNISTLCILEMTHRACQTDLPAENHHFAKIWQREREAELALARETAVALARAAWCEENEKTLKSRVDAIVRHRKEDWVKEGSLANLKEVETLKLKLSNAVTKTEDMREKIEKEYKNSLMKTNEEYKSEISKMLKVEREKSARHEKEVESLKVKMDLVNCEREELRTEKMSYVESDMRYKHEVERLKTLVHELKTSEEASRVYSTQTKDNLSQLKQELELRTNGDKEKEAQIRQQCEDVIVKMKDELLKFAENTNQQAMEYVKKTLAECKESTAQKYKKYYQRLLYCLIEKHPNVKNTVKHLQQTLPKQVARTPTHKTSTEPPRSTPNNTQTSNDSGIPSSQDSLFNSQPPVKPKYSRFEGYCWDEGPRSDSDITPSISNLSRSKRKLVLGRFPE